MRPWWHFLIGAIFTFVIWLVVPDISLLNLGLIFLASFVIDFDHYMAYFLKTREYGFRTWVDYHRKLEKKEIKEIERGIRKKSDFHLFHTIEFHTIIGLLGYFWVGFFYLFIGMIFHSLCDLVYLLVTGRLHRREYFLTNWIRKRI